LIDKKNTSLPAIAKGYHSHYVAVRNFLNQIAFIQLAPDLASDSVTRIITSPDFHIPTAIARFVKALCTVNARFDRLPTTDSETEVVSVLR
jgi:hypothetical protein